MGCQTGAELRSIFDLFQPANNYHKPEKFSRLMNAWVGLSDFPVPLLPKGPLRETGPDVGETVNFVGKWNSDQKKNLPTLFHKSPVFLAVCLGVLREIC